MVINLKLLGTSFYEEKKSKFYGYAYELDELTEVKEIIAYLKENNKKAKHIVYAYKFQSTAGKSDDKEPTGTAGLPLYNYLEKNNLNNTLIVVVRFFGGTKLGAGPLMRAYLSTGIKAFKN